jgi:DNA-binding NtrC family response regulator
MNTMAMAGILVIEDDPAQLRLYSKALRGYRLTCVANGTEALSSVRERAPDLIILDHVLADGERGTDFLPRLKAIAAHVPIIVISGTLDIHGTLKALQGPHSAHFVLEKPVDIDELEKTVEVALTECGVGETVRVLQSLDRAEKLSGEEPDRRFTERLARQHELLKRLRGSDDRANVSQLSRDFNVSRKTIIRDLRDLIQRHQLDPVVYPDWKDDLAAEE